MSLPENRPNRAWAPRRVLVALRDRLDRTLHPWRARRARQRLRAVAPRSVLFVCLGNICRSPFAARVLSRLAGPALESDSAGFIKPGRPAPESAIEAARAAGIDHADHRSKTVTTPMLRAADAIFVFDRYNVRRLSSVPGARIGRVFWLGDFDPEWAGKRAIPDPWGKPLEEFQETFARIDRCVTEVLRTLSLEES